MFMHNTNGCDAYGYPIVGGKQGLAIISSTVTNAFKTVEQATMDRS